MPVRVAGRTESIKRIKHHNSDFVDLQDSTIHLKDLRNGRSVHGAREFMILKM